MLSLMGEEAHAFLNHLIEGFLTTVNRGEISTMHRYVHVCEGIAVYAHVLLCYHR
jgi:hypothetical protein